MIDFTYLHQPPKKFTFEQVDLRKWTEKWATGKVLNLFAGKTRLNVDEIRVDLDLDVNPDYCMDAYEFLKTWDGEKFDTIIFDPPYNLRKSREKYNGKYFGSLRKIKDKMINVLNPGGLILHYGYDSVGLGRSRGFEKIAVCLVCHNGDHNDTICLVERMNQLKLAI